MNVWLNADGSRNREFRPYIEQEETARSVYLYNPEGRSFYYGLYASAQPTCGLWVDNIYNQYPSRTPAESVDSSGRLAMTQSNQARNYRKDPAYPTRY